MDAYRDTDAEDDVFRALADRSRRVLLDRLNERNGQTLRELCAGLDMARQSVSKHLAVLETADLVTTVRRGREKLHYLNPAPIADIGERWIRRYDASRVDALATLKRSLEETTMDRPSFVYTTYIRTTPELLWRGLTEPEFTRRYWGMEPYTDWKVGSPMTWEHRGVTLSDPDQVVLEYDPYRRLSFSWHVVNDELATAIGLSDEARDQLIAEPRSKVTFDLEEVGDQVKLTVVHDRFAAGSTMLGMISEGWPQVLAGLKTMLETGDLPPTVAAPATAPAGR